MITILITIIIFLILGTCSASISYFLNFCFKDGNIFGFWGNFLEDLSEKKPSLTYFLKPLGLCNICFNFWLSLFIFLAILSVYPIAINLSLLLFIPYIASSTLFIFILHELLND